MRGALAALNEIIDTDECYNIRQLAVTKRELMDRRLVSSEKEAEELVNVLFEMVLDKPSFNNKLMLIDMAQRSKQRLEERHAKRAEQQKARIEASTHKHHDRRSEPIFTKRKKPKTD